MAWIAIVPPSARHPHERYQVRYQDGSHQRSAGIFPTLRRAEAERRALERAGHQPLPRWTEVVAGLEGPAPHLRVRHPQEGGIELVAGRYRLQGGD